MQLKNGQEIIGMLKEIQIDDENIKTIFIIKKEIDIPKDKIQFKDLQELIEKQVGILNIDGIYKIRKIGREV